MKNRLFALSFFLIVLLPLRNGFAGSGAIFKNDVKHSVKMGARLFKAPLEFRGNDWLKVGAVVGGTSLLFFADKNVRRFAQSHQSAANDRVFSFDKFYGSKYTAAMTAGIYGLGLIFSQPQIRHVGLQSMEALFYSGLISSTIKIVLGRRRPYAGESHLFFKPGQLKDVFQSLPSGHTTISFAISTIFAKALDNNLWKTFWYGSATMVAASRIYHNKHWASDVFLGAAIGYFVADFIVKSDREDAGRLASKIQPFTNGRSLGVAIAF